jgi:RNA polymerase sigma-70 factor, ECF subfamily
VAFAGARPSRSVRHVLVNGTAGVIIVEDGRPITIMGFTVSEGKIVEIDAVTDRERLAQLDVGVLCA